MQAFGNRLTAGPGHAHGGEKQNGGFGLIAHCGKKHRFSTFPLLCRFFQQNNFIGKALLQLAAETAEPDVNEPETPDAEAPATTEKPAADESTKPETGKEDASAEGNGDGNGQVPPGQTEDGDGNIVNPGGNMAPGLNRGEHIDKPDNPNKPDKPENPGTEDKDDKKANKANKGTHIYTYDELNRMVSSEIAKVLTNYTYDTLGNLVLETSKNKSVDYEYNELNQLVRKTTSNNEVFTNVLSNAVRAVGSYFSSYSGCQTEYAENHSSLPQQGNVEGDVDGAPPVDAGKQGKHVEGHPNYESGKSTWANGEDGVHETQEGWLKGSELPDGTRVWDAGKTTGTQGETGVRVHSDKKGTIHGYPVNPGRYLGGK